jgi:hypothetical protein
MEGEPLMARTIPTIDLAHLVEAQSFTPYDGCYAAVCSCGWVGDTQRDAPSAEADGVDHREVAVGPGDGLDAVMSELLDMQDDLAQVVVWLAEHWSADLPVPTVYGSGGGPIPARMELSIYCRSPIDLGHVADLLGASPVDDPAPDVEGARYRRVTRRFGQVTVTVFATLSRPGRGRA